MRIEISLLEWQTSSSGMPILRLLTDNEIFCEYFSYFIPQSPLWHNALEGVFPFSTVQLSNWTIEHVYLLHAAVQCIQNKWRCLRLIPYGIKRLRVGSHFQIVTIRYLESVNRDNDSKIIIWIRLLYEKLCIGLLLLMLCRVENRLTRQPPSQFIRMTDGVGVGIGHLTQCCTITLFPKQ